MTDLFYGDSADWDISTHILTKRMTFPGKQSNERRDYFNSHPHEEDDLNPYYQALGINISTHILTKRMTM